MYRTAGHCPFFMQLHQVSSLSSHLTHYPSKSSSSHHPPPPSVPKELTHKLFMAVILPLHLFIYVSIQVVSTSQQKGDFCYSDVAHLAGTYLAVWPVLSPPPPPIFSRTQLKMTEQACGPMSGPCLYRSQNVTA